MKIGFVGAGRMAQALGSGIARNFQSSEFVVSDPTAQALQQFTEMVTPQPVVAVEYNQNVFDRSEVVFVAVKPQYLEVALGAVDVNADGPLVISVAAGFTKQRIAKLLGSERVIRVMPNTPCLIGKGIVALAPDETVSQTDIDTAKQLIATVGETVFVEESQLDAVTGLSGSGPAFIYRFIESLIEGGVQQGLDHETATQLTVQTVLGAASMVAETGKTCQQLIDQVTSPGGTTLAGLAELQRQNFGETVKSAVSSATARSVELGKA